jgi:hypothetical protein
VTLNPTTRAMTDAVRQQIKPVMAVQVGAVCRTVQGRKAR